MDSKIIYYVIKFENPPPSEDYDKYVCVPSSWVLGKGYDGRLAFRYPQEKMAVINKRIKDHENVSEEWPIYSETVKFGSPVLQNAIEMRRVKQRDFNNRGSIDPAGAKGNIAPIKRKLNEEINYESPNLRFEAKESEDVKVKEEDGLKEATDHDNSMKKRRIDDNADRRGSAGGSRGDQAWNNPSTSLHDSNAISTTLQDLVKHMKRMNYYIERVHAKVVPAAFSPQPLPR